MLHSEYFFNDLIWSSYILLHNVFRGVQYSYFYRWRMKDGSTSCLAVFVTHCVKDEDDDEAAGAARGLAAGARSGARVRAKRCADVSQIL